MWVVLTDPDKKNNRWTEEEFFATGKQQVADIFKHLESAGAPPPSGKALDFGCGVGRLTQALAPHFESVDGVDISATMVGHAEHFNRFAGRVKYHLNVRPNLSAFSSEQYSFICSLISLQHTPSRFQKDYLADFLRLLRPGGVAYFQTVHTLGWRQCVPDWAADGIRKWRSHGQAFIPLYGVPPRYIQQIFNGPGSAILKFESSPYGGWASRFASDLFIIRKKPA